MNPSPFKSVEYLFYTISKHIWGGRSIFVYWIHNKFIKNNNYVVTINQFTHLKLFEVTEKEYKKVGQ